MGREDGGCCTHCDQVSEMANRVADLRVESAVTSTGVKALVESAARIEKGMVTQHEFRPVRAVVYGIVGAVGITLIAEVARTFWK